MNTEAVKELLRHYNRKETKQVVILFKTDPTTRWTLVPTNKFPPTFNAKMQTISCTFCDDNGHDYIETLPIDLISKVRVYTYEVPPPEEARYKAKVVE